MRLTEGMTSFCRPTRKISITLVTFTKSQWDFHIGFQITAENKLCHKHKCMILTHFVQKDNLDEQYYDFWTVNAIARIKKLILGYKQTSGSRLNVGTVEEAATVCLFFMMFVLSFSHLATAFLKTCKSFTLHEWSIYWWIFISENKTLKSLKPVLTTDHSWSL